MTADRARVLPNLKFDPTAPTPALARTFAFKRAAAKKATPEDVQREIIDFDSEGSEGALFKSVLLEKMRKGCPALQAGRLGAYWTRTINGNSVVVFKSDSHLSQDTKKAPTGKQNAAERRPVGADHRRGAAETGYCACKFSGERLDATDCGIP